MQSVKTNSSFGFKLQKFSANKFGDLPTNQNKCVVPKGAKAKKYYKTNGQYTNSECMQLLYKSTKATMYA